MNSFKFPIILFLVLIIGCQCQQSKENRDKKTLPDEVVAVIEKRISEGVFPSIAIAIIDSSGIYYYNFGKTYADGIKVDENTIYEIGSISKAFTGILLAQQVVDGDVNLEDEINNFLPDNVKVPVMGDVEITLGHLTDHTSGLPRRPDNLPFTNPNNPFADYTVELMYDFLSNYQPVRTVGSKFEYSNLAQGLLGHILSLNKNTNYEDLMVQVIANSLGMNDTRITLTKRMKENLALGHRYNKVTENWDIPALEGCGGIRSSASDMARFISANLGYENTPLTEAMNLSHKSRHDKNGGGLSTGIAWFITKGKNGDMVWHTGGTGGYRTFAGFVKETGKGVVLLSNSSMSSFDIGFYLLGFGSTLVDRTFKSDIVELSESALDQYVGVYEDNSDHSKIAIDKEGSQLFIKIPELGRFELYPKNDSHFFLPFDNAKVTFRINNRTVERLILYWDGETCFCNKVE